MADSFQINPDWVKTGNFLIDGQIKKAIKDVNKADWNKNGVPDVSEFANVFFKVLPLLVALDAAVDFEKLTEQLAENPAIKDKELLHHTLLEFGKLAESASKLLPGH